MKTLVIAEKPSVGRDIGRVLHCQGKGNGSLEGPQYIVTWGLGHLVELQAPEGYKPEYKEWRMEDLPIMPEHLKTEVIRQTGKQFQTVKGLLHRKDVKDVVIATDAGREGELVARWILEKAGNKKPCRRLWISSVTDKAIREGFAHLKDAKEYDNLYRAAVSRAEADWLVGINATRALTCKYNAQLSCGRVQTPTLAMIAAREEEIRRFVPRSYYGLSMSGQGMIFQWKDKKSGSTSSFERERIEKIRDKCSGEELVILQVEKKEKRKDAPALYDLTELQREANQKFGFSAKETLNIMQRLYENHKVLTYPRTDSRYLTSDLVSTLQERLEACGTGPYRKLAAAQMCIRDRVHIAHEEGLAVMTHTNSARGVQRAAEAGVDSIEHGNFQDRESLDCLAESGAVWVPTCVTVKNLIGCGRFSDDILKRIYRGFQENLRYFYKKGGQAALGSDAGAYQVLHGQGLLDEYEAFSETLLPQTGREELDQWLKRGEAEIRKKF